MDRTPEHTRAFETGGAYGLLFLLGVMEGVIGCFQFSRGIGGLPVAAWVLCAVVFATSLLSGLGMGSVPGALVPAVGWFAASFVLTLPTSGGSVIVTNTTAGKWYLYGGTACAAGAVIIVYVARLRGLTARPGGSRPLPPGGRGPTMPSDPGPSPPGGRGPTTTDDPGPLPPQDRGPLPPGDRS